jgi:hypothetical protein
MGWSGEGEKRRPHYPVDRRSGFIETGGALAFRNQTTIRSNIPLHRRAEYVSLAMGRERKTARGKGSSRPPCKTKGPPYEPFCVTLTGSRSARGIGGWGGASDSDADISAGGLKPRCKHRLAFSPLSTGCVPHGPEPLVVSPLALGI